MSLPTLVPTFDLVNHLHDLGELVAASVADRFAPCPTPAEVGVPTRTAEILAEMRAENSAALSAQAAQAALNAEQREEYRKGALRRTRRYPVTSGERTRLPRAAALEMERRGSVLLRQAGEATGTAREQGNDTWKSNKLPRMAAGMAKKKGRGISENVAEQFVSSFGSQWSCVERLLVGFLPEKISHKDGERILGDLSGRSTPLAPRGFTFDPKGADKEAFRQAMRQVNPGSGRAGGRPRKVRESVGDTDRPTARGVLAGTYDPALVGMGVGGLRVKVVGCTCAGISGAGYRSCAGHGYRGEGRDASPAFQGRRLLDGTVIHTGDAGSRRPIDLAEDSE